MTWPSVSYVDHTWTLPAQWQPRAGEVSRRSEKYRAAIPPRIANLVADPSTKALAQAEAATNELSRFDAEHGMRLINLAPILLRSEAASSSRVENLTANARNIMAAELDMSDRQNAQEIAGNTAAMSTALELAIQPNDSAIFAMHSALLGNHLEDAGSWRNEAVWIGTSSYSPVGAEFVAPPHEMVASLIEDLTEFMHRDDVQPLVSVALAHAQFETIHPFVDGNGRTGRALAQALLRFRGVTRNVAIPVSAGLLANVNGYHRALDEYRAGNIDPIIEAFADAALRSITNSRSLVNDLDAVLTRWNEALSEAKVRRSSGAWNALEHILRRPVFTVETIALELGSQPTNVYPALNRLADLGIIKKHNVYRRGAYWSAPEALAAIDAFAERAGRRELV